MRKECAFDRREGHYPGMRRMNIKIAAEVILLAAVFFTVGFFWARIMPFKSDPLSGAREVVRDIRDHYYYFDEETEEKISVGVLKGIAAYLDDDYSAYYTQEEYAALTANDSGNNAGIGIQIKIEEGDCTVVSVFEDSPAQKAGLVSGDILKAVNGSLTEDLSLNEAVQLFRIEAGNENTIIILRDNEEMTFKVTAGEYYVPYVHARMLNDHIGYIHISGFHGKVTDETETALRTLTEEGMDALVLDVRDNPGGTLTDVRKIADAFLPKGSVITTLKTRLGTVKEYKTELDGLNIPVAMLVNGDSASASELLAGALHDNGAAILFGTKTYGKGIVQTYFELDGGEKGAFKMTTEAYYTPADICIQKEGITPDHWVDLPENISYDYIYELTLEEDPQLSEAIRYLEEA